MGKQAKLKKTRQNKTLQFEKSYLDLDHKSASNLRCAVADVHLHLLPKKQQKSIFNLPESFYSSFYYLLGHVLVGARHWEFWDQISENLLAITKGTENESALAAWNHGSRQELYSNPRIFCYNLLQKLPDTMSPMRAQTCKEEILRHGIDCAWYQEGIPHHIGISGSIAGGCILHNSGSLYLLDSGHARNNDHELWLARLRNDGIYATSKLGKIGNLKVSEIKSMRDFVVNYKGEPLSGEIETLKGNDAARICMAIGMKIENGLAWIGK